MPKKNSAPTTGRSFNGFPVKESGSFTAKTDDADKATDYKVLIVWNNIDELVECAKRAVIIQCGTLAREGKFPAGRIVQVGSNGAPVKTAEEKLKDALPNPETMNEQERAAYIKMLQAQMEMLKGKTSVKK